MSDRPATVRDRVGRRVFLSPRNPGVALPVDCDLMGATMDSNTSRPMPPPNTGSVLLNLISNLSLKFLHLERRFDPWLRPAFDATLRDPMARLVTALINRGRP